MSKLDRRNAAKEAATRTDRRAPMKTPPERGPPWTAAGVAKLRAVSSLRTL